MKKLIISGIFLCATFLSHSQENVLPMNHDINRSPVIIDFRNDSIFNLKEIVPRLGTNELLKFENPYTIDPEVKYVMPVNSYFNTHTGIINPYFSYSMSGESNLWRGITMINHASFNLNYHPDRFLFTLGTGLWKYDDLGHSFKDFTFHADASYELFPWWIVGLYGQYSRFAGRNVRHGSALSTPMVPFTGFGAYSRVMFNSTFGIEGSVGRQFNPIKGKWEPTYGFGPVIELKRKKR